MKKSLLILSLIIGNIVFAQTNFTKINSTQDFIKIQKSINKEERLEFYSQFLRVKLFEDIKKNFVSKNYTDDTLRKFADSILSSHKVGVEPYEEEMILSFEEYEKREKEKDENSKQSDALFKEMFKVSKEDSTRLADVISKMKTPQKTGNLKTDYQNYLSQVQKSNMENAFSPINRSLILQNLDDLFQKNNYYSEETQNFLERNFDPNSFDNPFPTPVNKHNGELEIYEIIPNEILAFGSRIAISGKTYENYYRIVDNNVVPISVFPVDDEWNINNDFENKISKYVGNNAKFYGGNDIKITKAKNEYLLETFLYKSDDEPCCPTFEIQYKTLDFKKFIPVKYRNNQKKSKWKVIL
ncbi:MAG: hypothetical protein KA796_13270 [Chryseobacterium sp.]|nr:hypothetical protein [Chryseobacterium sp.]